MEIKTRNLVNAYSELFDENFPSFAGETEEEMREKLIKSITTLTPVEEDEGS